VRPEHRRGRGVERPVRTECPCEPSVGEGRVVGLPVVDRVPVRARANPLQPEPGDAGVEGDQAPVRAERSSARAGRAPERPCRPSVAAGRAALGGRMSLRAECCAAGRATERPRAIECPCGSGDRAPGTARATRTEGPGGLAGPGAVPSRRMACRDRLTDSRSRRPKPPGLRAGSAKEREGARRRRVPEALEETGGDAQAGSVNSWYMTCRPTRPWAGCSNERGTVPITRKPSRS
jgi:hypothetical protein